MTMSSGSAKEAWAPDWTVEQYGSGVKGLVFDCDGTLVNSMPMWAENWRRTCKDFGIDFSEDRFYELAGKTLDDTLTVLASEQHVEVDHAEFFRAKDKIVEDLIEYVEEIKPVCDIARHHHNRIPMAVVSSGPRGMVMRLLEQCHLAHLFSVIICAEDVTEHKPHPQPFLRAAHLLNLPPAALRAFEDADAGCESARAAGMPTVDVRLLPSYPLRSSPAPRS